MAWPVSVLGDWFGVRYPIVQAPLAQVARSELVAAVNAAGALGSLGSSVWPEHEVRQEVARVRERSERPGEGAFNRHPSPASRLRRSAPSPAGGEGKEQASRAPRPSVATTRARRLRAQMTDGS